MFHPKSNNTCIHLIQLGTVVFTDRITLFLSSSDRDSQLISTSSYLEIKKGPLCSLLLGMIVIILKNILSHLFF